MEIFLDGGLFEVFIILMFAYSINYIFLRKYLLIIYSILAIAIPPGLFIVKSGVLFDMALVFCIFNSIILILLLWTMKIKEPTQRVIDLDMVKSRFVKKKKLDGSNI